MDLGLRVSREGADTSSDRGTGHDGLASNPGGLDCKGFTHDGASLTQKLQLGDSATAWGSLGASGSRKRTQGGRGGLLEERAHGPRLAKDSVHCN
jgi:hypothetical protein